MSAWNQYGLYHDDTLHEYDDVKEALRRLPPNLVVSLNMGLKGIIWTCSRTSSLSGLCWSF